MLTLTQRLPQPPAAHAELILALTAEERVRSRHYVETADGQPLYLNLPRGTVLRHGDWLTTAQGDRWVQIIARPEPVITVTADQTFDLVRAAYHLGNRHVPLEITAAYLRLEPDPVLQTMLEQMGVHVIAEMAPFQPEAGAYGSSTHSHHSTQSHPAHAPSP